MSLWERLLRSGLEASIRLLEGFGARGVRWAWRKQAWRNALARRIAEWENVARGVRVRMRMCPSCRSLVERRQRSCPACGASLRGVQGGGLHRVLRLFVPGNGTVTMLLITINVIMSLVIYGIWGAGSESSGLLGLFAPPGRALYVFGAKWTPAILSGQIWRLVTASYLHGGIIHLLFNCYTLSSLGPLIENSFGARKFFLIYSVTGVVAFATSALFRPASLSIGASGALFGILGFAIVFGRFRSGPSGRAIADQLMRYLIFMVLLFLIPGIDNAAHIGGLLSGGVLGLLIDGGEPRTPAGDFALTLLTAAAVIATVGSFVAMGLSYEGNLRAIGGG